MINKGIEGFKKYISKGRAYTPRVAIRKNGDIAFNMGAVHKYDLDVFEYLVLYISEDRKRIGVQFTNNDKESGICKVHSRKGNFAINARTFLSLNDIPWEKTTNYDFIWNDTEKTAIFKVKE